MPIFSCIASKLYIEGHLYSSLNITLHKVKYCEFCFEYLQIAVSVNIDYKKLYTLNCNHLGKQ